MKAINIVCRNNGVLIQVMSKVEVERAIMKENEIRFKLTSSFPMLNSDICVDLGLSGEGLLTKEILSSQRQLEDTSKVREIFQLLRNSKHNRMLLINSVEQ